MKMRTAIGLTCAAILLTLLGIINFASASTFRVVQTPSLHLYTGEAAAATSMRITPYPRDLDNVKLVMSDFGTFPTVTVDPKLSGYEEIEGFTGITDNGDNTATLTGLSRDLQSKYPYTGTGTGRTHGSGAVVVFSNNPQIYGRLAAPENVQTWTAVQTFSFSPIVPTPVGATDAANKAYVDSVAVAGAPNATESVKGIVELASQIEQASSSITGSTAAGLVLQARYATSSPGTAGLWTVITRNSGKVAQAFLDLTEQFNFSSIFAANSSSTNATTTRAWITSTLGILKTDGNGQVVSAAAGVDYKPQSFSFSTSTAVSAPAAGGSTATYATSTGLTVPSGTFSASSTIDLVGYMSACTVSSFSTGSPACYIHLRNASGTDFARFQVGAGLSSNTSLLAGSFVLKIINNSSLSSQLGTSAVSCLTSGSNANVCGGNGSVSSSINTAGSVTLFVVVEANNGGGSNAVAATLGGFTLSVNP